MNASRKISAILLNLALITHVLLMAVNTSYGNTTQDFIITYINVRSLADTAEIYPGSSRVTLKVQAVYLNDTPAQKVVG